MPEVEMPEVGMSALLAGWLVNASDAGIETPLIPAVIVLAVIVLRAAVIAFSSCKSVLLRSPWVLPVDELALVLPAVLPDDVAPVADDWLPVRIDISDCRSVHILEPRLAPSGTCDAVGAPSNVPAAEEDEPVPDALVIASMKLCPLPCWLGCKVGAGREASRCAHQSFCPCTELTTCHSPCALLMRWASHVPCQLKRMILRAYFAVERQILPDSRQSPTQRIAAAKESRSGRGTESAPARCPALLVTCGHALAVPLVGWLHTLNPAGNVAALCKGWVSHGHDGRTAHPGTAEGRMGSTK